MTPSAEMQQAVRTIECAIEAGNLALARLWVSEIAELDGDLAAVMNDQLEQAEGE